MNSANRKRTSEAAGRGELLHPPGDERGKTTGVTHDLHGVPGRLVHHAVRLHIVADENRPHADCHDEGKGNGEQKADNVVESHLFHRRGPPNDPSLIMDYAGEFGAGQ